MSIIAKNKLKLVAMREISKQYPNISVSEGAKKLNEKMEHYKYVLSNM